MRIKPQLFRLSICAALLAASTMACSDPSNPGGTNGASPTPGAAVTASSSPVAQATVEPTSEEGTPLEGKAAYLAGVEIFSDKIDGTPFGRGKLDLLLVPSSSQMPGLVEAAKDMKVGEKKELELTAEQLFGELPAGAKLDPATQLYIRLTAKDAFPEEEFKVETVTEGSGDKTAEEGDVVMVHYEGRLDNFEDGEKFDSSRDKGTPFPLKLGEGKVIPGWEQGLKGMKKGEVRRLSIPHYLAYGVQDKGNIPPKSRLFFEVELLEFVQPGELKKTTVTEGKGEAIESGQRGQFHYTGWLDGFNGESKFDSSYDRNKPIEVTVGAGQVIEGWDQGLVGMKPGEIRHLEIPYNLAYGEGGRPPIPPFAKLYFKVEYVGPAGGATPSPSP